MVLHVCGTVSHPFGFRGLSPGAGTVHTFSRNDALAAMGVSPVALKRDAARLKAKRRLAAPRRGPYTIVPLEYRRSGAPPATSFIDQFMRFRDTPYYAGLLSTGELHGAAHQKPQEFQVFAAEQLRPTSLNCSEGSNKRGRICGGKAVGTHYKYRLGGIL